MLVMPFAFSLALPLLKKERKKTDNPREGWGDGTPPPHRDFKETLRCWPVFERKILRKILWHGRTRRGRS